MDLTNYSERTTIKEEERMRTSGYWRMRAEEVRTIADTTRAPLNRAILSRIACDYDRLAEHADNDGYASIMMRLAADYDHLFEVSNEWRDH